MENSEQFVAKVIQIGNSLGVTIPKNNIDYSGIKEGDVLKICYIKKME
jgi:antitoxin component of MazEF toxin-antitoxin module